MNEPASRESKVGLFLMGALLVAGLVGGAVIYDRSTNQRFSESDSGFNFSKVETDRGQPKAHFGASRPSEASSPVAPRAGDGSLSMVRTGTSGVPSSVVPQRRPADPNSFEGQLQLPQQDQAPRPRAAAPEPPKLSTQDEAVLKNAVGSWNQGSAAQLGADMSRFLSAVQQLFRAPKALKFVLDNDTLITAVMSQKLVNTNCSSAPSLKRYYLDARNGTTLGVSRALDVLQASTRYPGATQAILGSRLVQTASVRCPSVAAVANDPALVKDIFLKNPKLAQVMSNPAVVAPLTENPATRDHMNRVLSAQMSNLH